MQEPAFARAALELVFELKAGAVSAEDFARAAAEIPPSRQDRARFLARLHAAYEARMAELRLADWEDAVRGALDLLKRGELPEALEELGRASFNRDPPEEQQGTSRGRLQRKARWSRSGARPPPPRAD